MASLLNAISNTLVFVLIGRSIGVIEYGDLMTFLSYVTIFYSFGPMGAPQYILQDKTNEFLINRGLLKFYTTIFIFTSIIAVNIVGYFIVGTVKGWVIIASFLIATQSIFELASAVYQKDNKLDGMIRVALLYNPLKLFVVLMVYVSGVHSLAVYMCALVLPIVFMLHEKKVALNQYRVAENIVVSWGLPEFFALLRKSAPYAGDAIVYIAYFQIVILLLGMNCGPTCVSSFAPSYTIASATYLAAAVYFQKIEQISIIENVGKNFSSAKRSIKLNIVKSLVAGTVVAICVALYGRNFVGFLYGEKFLPFEWVMIFLSMAIPIRYAITSMAAHLFTPVATKIKLIIVSVVLIFNIIVSNTLIVNHGVTGGSIAVLISEIIWFFLLWFASFLIVQRKNYNVI